MGDFVGKVCGQINNCDGFKGTSNDWSIGVRRFWREGNTLFYTDATADTQHL